MGGDSGKRGDPGMGRGPRDGGRLREGAEFRGGGAGPGVGWDSAMEKRPRSGVRTQSQGGVQRCWVLLGLPHTLGTTCVPGVSPCKGRGLRIPSKISGGKEAAAEPAPECR